MSIGKTITILIASRRTNIRTTWIKRIATISNLKTIIYGIIISIRIGRICKIHCFLIISKSVSVLITGSKKWVRTTRTKWITTICNFSSIVYTITISIRISWISTINSLFSIIKSIIILITGWEINIWATST
ncbi:hypothetical protein D3C87_1023170 [compost metagenome]